MTLNGQSVQDVIIAITLIGGVVLYARNRIPQQNVAQLTALTGTYEKRIKALEDEVNNYHNTILDNAKAIADLQGQVKVYKELPLRELADGIKKVADSNDEILNTLQKSALIGAEDHDVTIKTDIHKEVGTKK